MKENQKDFTAEPTACTLSEMFSEWHQRIIHNVKESIAANYLVKATKHILPCFGNKAIGNITSEDVYGFISQKKAAGLSSRYILDIVILMKSLFKYAVRKFRIANSMEKVTMKKVKTAEISLLDTDEQARLERYLWQHQDRTSMGIALSMATGLRIGELCALRWEDTDLEKRILTATADSRSARILLYKADNDRTEERIPKKKHPYSEVFD